MAHGYTRGGPRRKTQWGAFGSPAGAATIPTWVNLTAGTAAIISTAITVAGTVGLLDEEFTITRTIGRFNFATNVSTANLTGSVAVGCAVARVEAITAGVASLPSPEEDPDFEWLFYGVYGVKNPAGTLQDGPLSASFIDFDVRGQRIVRRGETIIWLAESETLAMQAMIGGRYLVKLT